MADGTTERLAKLVGPSYYAWQEGDVVECPSLNNIKKGSRGSIEEAFIRQKLTRSDFFLALGVQSLVYCDVDQLRAWLVWYKRMYPGKLIAEDEKSIKSRLETLVKEGVLRLFYCQDLDRVKLTKRSKFYSVTELGALAVKEALDGEDLSGYNAWVGIKPAYAMLRRLDATNCIAALTASRSLVEIDCHSRNVEKNKVMDIYGSLTFARMTKVADKENAEFVKVYVEPVHFTHDDSIRSTDELESAVRKRIDTLINKRNFVLRSNNNRYSDVKIVLVFDGKEAFRFVSQYIGQQYQELIPSITFTSQNLIYCGDKLSEKFVRVSEAGLVYPTDWIFEEE